MDGFKRRTEQKKENIRRAAIELFDKHGFKKVSLADIARKAGVSHVTIYNHFHSKEELVTDVIKAMAINATNKAREIIESDRPYLEKLNLLMFNKTSVMAGYKGELFKAVVDVYPEIKRFSDEIRAKETNILLEKLVEEGKRLKYIKADLSARAIMYFFLIIRNGVYADKELLQSIEIDDKLVQDIMYLCMFGLIEKQK